jgi:hypothetical protein
MWGKVPENGAFIGEGTLACFEHGGGRLAFKWEMGVLFSLKVD